jgi:hypothetical protein
MHKYKTKEISKYMPWKSIKHLMLKLWFNRLGGEMPHLKREKKSYMNINGTLNLFFCWMLLLLFKQADNVTKIANLSKANWIVEKESNEWIDEELIKTMNFHTKQKQNESLFNFIWLLCGCARAEKTFFSSLESS